MRLYTNNFNIQLDKTDKRTDKTGFCIEIKYQIHMCTPGP